MAEHTVTVESTLTTLISNKKYPTVKDILVTMNPSDIAAVFEDVEQDQLSLLFRLLPKDLAAEAFVEMEPELQEILIHHFSDTELRSVMNELYVDDAAELIDEMPANVVERILAQTPADMRKDINNILRYPDNSAGSMMTTEYVNLKPGMSVAEAIIEIRRTGVDKETIYTCYVTENQILIGYVTVKDILVAKDEQKIAEIMQVNVISVSTLSDQEEVAQMLSKYNFIALPVVDSENRMVGIVTFDDAMDVLVEETTEDMEKMGGMIPSEKSYMRSTPMDIFKQRIPWLSVLMISATFTSIIISSFENALAAQVVLTAFIPMLTGTGGNSGTQSSVAVIRAISLGEVEFSDLIAIIWKEIRTGVMCGIVLAVLCFCKIMLIDGFMMGNSEITPIIALVVSVAMVFTVLIAKTIGCIMPMFAKKVGADPAVMASPFISTIVDALSLLIYFGVVNIILF